MIGQRQLCSSMALQEPSAGSPSTGGFLWGLSWAISPLSLWPSPVRRGWHNPKVAWQDTSITVAISTWWGRPGPKVAWPSPWPPSPCGMRHGPGVAQKISQVSGPSVPPPPKHPPGCSCGAEFWGTFTRTRHSWGRRCHPKEKGFSCIPIHARCPVASHPPK